jgi:RimJ/RimL family protein N-acetyltransferase
MIELKPFSRSDFQRLTRWVDSPELMVQWAGPVQFRFPLDEQQLTRYLQTTRSPHPTARIFTASDERGKPVGHIELGAINQDNGTASVCRVFVGPAERGRGIGLSMMRAILTVGFGELLLRRIELKVYAFNTCAIRCYEHAGFKREGVLRQSTRVGDRIWDTVLMGILREEWKPEPGA